MGYVFSKCPNQLPIPPQRATERPRIRVDIPHQLKKIRLEEINHRPEIRRLGCDASSPHRANASTTRSRASSDGIQPAVASSAHQQLTILPHLILLRLKRQHPRES